MSSPAILGGTLSWSIQPTRSPVDHLKLGDIYERLQRASQPLNDEPIARTRSPEEALFESLSSFKIRISQVAMHLEDDWRQRLFGQLDSLLSAEDWDPKDVPPTLQSFTTFLRTMLFLAPRRRPGLGATADGHIVGSWTTGDRRLTIEFLPNDRVRYVVSLPGTGGRDVVAGLVGAERLAGHLQAYDPHLWFDHVGSNGT